MKSIPAPLQADYDLETTTTCLLAKVECLGMFAGLVFGFTNLDIDVTYDDDSGDPPLLYECENGFLAKQYRSSSNGDIDNSEIDGLISAGGITEAMIRAGLFRSAKITIYRVNFENLTAGRHEVVEYGRIGKPRYTRGGWTNEFRSLMQLLRQPIGMCYGIPCNWQFGDENCQAPLVWTAGTVTAVGVEADMDFEDSSDVEPDGFYAPGVTRWITGNNAGAEMEIEEHVTGVFRLSLPLPHPIEVGDTYERRDDCDKLFETCRDEKNNKPQFGGHNLMPVDGNATIPGTEIDRV